MYLATERYVVKLNSAAPFSGVSAGPQSNTADVSCMKLTKRLSLQQFVQLTFAAGWSSRPRSISKTHPHLTSFQVVTIVTEKCCIIIQWCSKDEYVTIDWVPKRTTVHHCTIWGLYLSYIETLTLMNPLPVHWGSVPLHTPDVWHTLCFSPAVSLNPSLQE